MAFDRDAGPYNRLSGADDVKACMTDAAEEMLARLRSDGIVHSPRAMLTPMAGGVSSEIFRVDDGEQTFVVKRALAKLKVQDEWIADVCRNQNERRYIEYVACFLPLAVPALRYADRTDGYFVMEYLGSEYLNWKELLLRGDFEIEPARAAAHILGDIHRVSCGDAEAATAFGSPSCFHQLRLEPYLLTTARRHPQLRDLMEAEVRRLTGSSECLVHGDYSPKNILVGRNRTVILDCEVAWYGDPAFDVCFLLSHLFLKSLYHSGPRDLAQLIRVFWHEYTLEAGSALEDRVPRLLLMLLLARIDGKSPVEYLSEPQRAFVRRFACAHLPCAPASLLALSDIWFSELANFGAER